MPQVAEWIDRTVRAAADGDESGYADTAAQVRDFLADFPIFGETA
jgi:glycine hydroxymethyltransferase